MSEFHQRLWDEFCKAEKIADAPLLFDADSKLVVSVKQSARGKKLKILKRSAAMEQDLSSKAIKVRDDAKGPSPSCQGLLYMMFLKEGDRVIPLYIGKAEKGGRKNETSRLFTYKNCPLPRWDDGAKFHIGGLSTWVCEDYAENEREGGKDKWAQKLFETFPASRPTLKSPVYLWVRVWKNNEIGFWPEYGATSMCMQEGMLIDIVSRLYPNDLLNTEGILR